LTATVLVDIREKVLKEEETEVVVEEYGDCKMIVGPVCETDQTAGAVVYQIDEKTVSLSTHIMQVNASESSSHQSFSLKNRPVDTKGTDEKKPEESQTMKTIKLEDMKKLVCKGFNV
jgi:hypothetical protein